MSILSAITVQEKHKDRCNLFVDNEFFKGVSLDIVYEYRLKVGQEIDKEQLAEIVFSAEKTDAFNKALNYISRTVKTKSQIKTYLINKGFQTEVVFYVIDKLKEYKYIDDTEYSKRYIESTSKTQGKRLTEYKLIKKGVKKEDIEQAFTVAEIDSEQDAVRLAEKRLKNKEITKENLQKTYRYLIGRGFSYEEASNAISKFNKD